MLALQSMEFVIMIADPNIDAVFACMHETEREKKDCHWCPRPLKRGMICFKKTGCLKVKSSENILWAMSTELYEFADILSLSMKIMTGYTDTL